MRLSVLYRKPLEEVMGWPLGHLKLIARFIAIEKTVEERVEHLLAELTALTFNVNKAKTSSGKAPSDYLTARKAWPAKEGRYSAGEMAMLQSLQSARGGKKK